MEAVRVEELRPALSLPLTAFDDPGGELEALTVSSSASILGWSARRASSGDSVSSIANSRAENPVVARSLAVGVKARCLRTSARRLVAMPLVGLIAKAVRRAETASSKFRCSRWQRPSRVHADSCFGACSTISEFTRTASGPKSACFISSSARFSSAVTSVAMRQSAICNQKGPTVFDDWTLSNNAGSDFFLSLAGPHPRSHRLARSRSAIAAGALSYTSRTRRLPQKNGPT